MSLAHWATALAGVGLCVIGVYATIAPRSASGHYGVAIDDRGPALAFGAAAGIRDIAIGALLIYLAVSVVSGDLLGGVVMLTAIVPAGDFIVIRRHQSTNVLAHLMHGGGVIGMLVLGAWLLLVG